MGVKGGVLFKTGHITACLHGDEAGQVERGNQLGDARERGLWEGMAFRMQKRHGPRKEKDTSAILA